MATIPPQDPRGPRLARPHETLTPRRTRDDGSAGGACVGGGGVPAAAGLVVGLLALAILWLDWAYFHTGTEAAAVATAAAVAAVAILVLGRA